MSPNLRPIVLVHGLWDTPRVFSRLLTLLHDDHWPVSTPWLQHKLGRIPLYDLAYQLNKHIIETWGPERSIDLLGFSMGGLVGRIWIQKMDGASRVHRFFSIGSPHRGTYTAQLIPHCLFPGIADMKRGSQLLNDLDFDLKLLNKVQCLSCFCKWDLMAFPGKDCVLPIGSQYKMPVFTHKALIRNQSSLKRLKDLIVINDL